MLSGLLGVPVESPAGTVPSPPLKKTTRPFTGLEVTAGLRYAKVRPMPGDAVLLQLTVVVKQFRGYVLLPEVHENQFVPEHAVVLPTGGVRDPSDSEPCAWAGVGSRAKAITASAEASNS